MTNNSTTLTAGMDLGDKKHIICILDDNGDVVNRASVGNNASTIRDFFSELQETADVRVVIETGTHSPWISRFLEEQGCEVLVGNSRKLRAIWQTDRKDDVRDAEMLARIGRFDPKLLYPIRHRGEQAQQDLAVIRARDTLVRCRSTLINCCRGIVKSHGMRLPACSADSFGRQIPEHIPEVLLPAVGPLVSQIAEMTARIQRYEGQIEALSQDRYPETEYLRQVTGVGALTSLAYILVIEDPTRFNKSRQVGPFLGLVPGRDQSSETDKQLGISKSGDELLRRLLTQSAHYILGPFGPDCDLRRHGMRVLAKGGKRAKQRAVTAVARKLAVLLHRLWVSGEDYDPFYNSGGQRRENIRPAA